MRLLLINWMLGWLNRWEWADHGLCLVCRRPKRGGHAADCRMAETLKRLVNEIDPDLVDSPPGMSIPTSIPRGRDEQDPRGVCPIDERGYCYRHNCRNEHYSDGL